MATKVPTPGELIYRVTGDLVMSKIMGGEILPVESISHELISQYTHEPMVMISTFEHARGLTDDINKSVPFLVGFIERDGPFKLDRFLKLR